MKRAQPWPGKENPIIGIAFELFVGFDEEGQPVYGRGQAHSQEELRTVQALIEPLQLSPASISSVTMGKVQIKLEDDSIITFRPVFHPSLDVYKDLFKVNKFDCAMPAPFADILNRWRRQLLGER